MSVSPTVTEPPSTGTTPTSAFNNVDFPEPFGPTMETTFPGSASTSISWTMARPSYPAETDVARSIWPGVERSPDKVRLHHFFVRPQFGHRSLCQHAAFGEHDDRIAERVHDGE